MTRRLRPGVPAEPSGSQLRRMPRRTPRSNRRYLAVMKLSTVVSLVLASFLAPGVAICQASEDSTKALFQERFDDVLDWEQDWLVEGTGVAWIEDGRLVIQEDSAGVGVVVWTRRDWPADMEASFEVLFSNNRCIGVFFFAARGSTGEDAFETRTHRTGEYEEYIRGDLDNYSLSLHRYFPDGKNNPGSNVRRNPGFHLLQAAMPDPALDSDRWYSVTIRKSGRSIRVSVDGAVTHDLMDETLGGPLGHGKIGLRLRGDRSCRMEIDEFSISVP